MAGNTKNLVRDAAGIVAPQYYNPSTDAYEYAQGSNGALNVQLTGSKVALQQTVLPRMVRNNNTPLNDMRKIVMPPDDAVGFIVIHRLYGVTGVFTTGQGIAVSATSKVLNNIIGNYSIGSVTSAASNNVMGHQQIIIYPGAVIGDMTPESLKDVKVSGIPVCGMLWQFALTITGTFGTGEGIDSEVTVIWLR